MTLTCVYGIKMYLNQKSGSIVSNISYCDITRNKTKKVKYNETTADDDAYQRSGDEAIDEPPPRT